MPSRPDEIPLCRGRYVVSTAPRSRGDLLRVEPGFSVGAGLGRKCWEVFFSRAGPCAGCPAFELAPGREKTGVLEELDGPFSIVHVARATRSARVTAISLSDAVLVDLVRGKLRRQVDAAGLSEKQRRVLDLLLLGRQTRDIATALEISERTVKFHVTNILVKLSADSRRDLARKLLLTTNVVSSAHGLRWKRSRHAPKPRR
jgi:DNA-binding CsgD family transcriptional regulator